MKIVTALSKYVKIQLRMFYFFQIKHRQISFVKILKWSYSFRFDKPTRCDTSKAWISYLEIRDGINENSTMIGTRLCGDNPPSIPIYASGSEIHIHFFSASLCDFRIETSIMCNRYRRKEGPHGLDAILTKLKGFRGFKMKIEAETGNIMKN